MMRPVVAAIVALALAGSAAPASAYPVDGYDRTGIRRLDRDLRIMQGEVRGPRRHPGQYLPTGEVYPRWHVSDGATLPPPDADFSHQLRALLDADARRNYGIAVLDLSDPQHPLYGTHNADLRANVGSVGKILVALAVFQQLAELYPDDLDARLRVLHDSWITADIFSQYDHHHVPFWNPETKAFSSRSIRIGDRATLWEFLDWMMSASSNSAAAMVQKELIALSHFGRAYPPTADQEAAFFADTSNRALGEIMLTAMNDAAIRNGLDPERFRQGSFFTRSGNKRVSTTSSYGTPEQLVKYLFRLEAGTLVDAFSSTEIKRLLYMTQRRIRYASHPALNDAAVYFKSGSFFQCLNGPGSCKKYHGDKTNRLASVAIIESPAGAPRYHYLVAVMSNVLYVNSAVAHQTLAMRIHRLIERIHRQPATTPPPEPTYAPVPVDGNGNDDE